VPPLVPQLRGTPAARGGLRGGVEHDLVPPAAIDCTTPVSAGLAPPRAMPAGLPWLGNRLHNVTQNTLAFLAEDNSRNQDHKLEANAVPLHATEALEGEEV
jgi:hypothetical protein